MKISPPPKCLDDYQRGQVAAERDCETCSYLNVCKERTGGIMVGRKKHQKLDRALVAFAIDLFAGSQLMMIGMRYPDRAEKLQSILAKACNDMYKEQVNQDVASPEAVALALKGLINELVGIFVMRMVEDCIKNGMPQESSLIHAAPPGMMQ